MASSLTTLKYPAAADEVLAYLPESVTVEYRKGHIIYGPARPSTHLYLVLSGTVAISQITENGNRVLLKLIGRDELLGHSGFVGSRGVSEEAAVLEPAKVLMWSIAAIEETVMNRPR